MLNTLGMLDSVIARTGKLTAVAYANLNRTKEIATLLSDLVVYHSMNEQEGIYREGAMGVLRP